MINFISKNPQVIKYDNETFYGFNELDSDIKKYYFFNKQYAFAETENNKFYFLYPENYKLDNTVVKLKYDNNSLIITSCENKNNVEILNISRIYYNKTYIFSQGTKKMLYTNYDEFFLELYKHLIIDNYDKKDIINEIKYHIEYAKLISLIDEQRIKYIFDNNKHLILENYGKCSLLDKILNDKYYILINTYNNFSVSDTCNLCNTETKLLLLGCMNKHYVCNNCYWQLNNKCPFCRYKFSNKYGYFSD